MTNENIIVKVDVTQIKDGREYNGNLAFDDLKLRYNIRFGVHLKEFMDLATTNTAEALREIHYDVWNENGKNISLDDRAKSIVLNTAGELVMDFYQDQQTRDHNTGMLGSDNEGNLAHLMHGWGHSRTGITASMSREYEILRHPEIEEFIVNCRKSEEEVK
jgi:hypothetical protein